MVWEGKKGVREMSDYNRIEAGDTVDVYFTNSNYVKNLTVYYVACSEGDSWHLRKNEDGQLIYVQRFEQIRLVKKKD